MYVSIYDKLVQYIQDHPNQVYDAGSIAWQIDEPADRVYNVFRSDSWTLGLEIAGERNNGPGLGSICLWKRRNNYAK